MKRTAFLLLALPGAALAQSPFATEVVASTGLAGTGLYNDPLAVLGKPTTKFNNGTSASPEFRRAKIIEGTFNTGLAGEKLLTTFNRNATNPDLSQSVTVKFDHLVTDDPANPFGLDFIVFGNAFFGSNAGFTSDATNLNTTTLSGAIFSEPVKLSVSPDNVNWFTYDSGPYADTFFPTNAYRWDRAGARWTDEELDFTRPVDPALNVAGLTAADALDRYAGSAGGTGFDLSLSGFSAIQYIRVTGATGFSGGEIDAFSDVSPATPVPEPATLATLAFGALALIRRRSLRK